MTLFATPCRQAVGLECWLVQQQQDSLRKSKVKPGVRGQMELTEIGESDPEAEEAGSQIGMSCPCQCYA